MKIDIHNHVIPTNVLDLLRRESLYGVRLDGSHWSGGHHVDFMVLPSFTDPAAKLRELAGKGLDASVISAAPPLFLYDVDPEAGELASRITNEGLADFCRHDPGRLRWMAQIPMQAPERAVAVLDEAARIGASGVEIGTSVAGRRLDEPEFEPFWAGAERLDLPVMIHPAYNEPNAALAPYYLQNVIGNMVETTIAIERLICAGVLDRHPRLRLVLVHSGGYFPYQAGRLKHARTVRPELASAPDDPWAYLDRLFFDSITHDREALRYLVSRVGPDRVLVGTDLPFDMSTPEPMRALNEAVDTDAAQQIAERNPANLFRFES